MDLKASRWYFVCFCPVLWKFIEVRQDVLVLDCNKLPFSIPCRIDEEIQRLQKRQRELLEEWKNSCNLTLKWIADTSARVQAQATTAEDLDHARAQRQEIEVGKICS